MRYSLPFALVPLVLLAMSSGPARQRAVVSGGVTDATTGEALSAVNVEFGERPNVVTDAKGNFRLAGVVPGGYAARFSHDGYRSKVLHVTVDRGDHELYVVVVLVPLAVEGDSTALHTDTTSVVADGRYIGFYRRRHDGKGYFFTRRDIERLDPTRATDLLRSIPGVWFGYDRAGQVFVTFHVSGAGTKGCAPAVYLDGARAGGFISLDELIHPGRIEAMEVYTGVPLKPLAFPESCVIAVWTR